VALSGDGGDELFAGYTGYTKFKNIRSFPLNFSSPFLNKMLWGNMHDLMPISIKGKGLLYYLSQHKEYAFAYQTTWNTHERRRLLNNQNGRTGNQVAELYKEGILRNKKSVDLITNFQHLDMKTYMVDDILTKVDRASMMNSLEVRVPMLDHVFAELSFKIPWNLKLNASKKKYILKKSMEKYLPESILNHPKQGFGVPLALWFKKDLKQFVNDTLLSDNPLLSNYVNTNYVKKIVMEDRKGRRDFNLKIWSLIILDQWLKQSQLMR
jgi:asparagine synthase (glutamine-hydrolysing)